MERNFFVCIFYVYSQYIQLLFAMSFPIELVIARRVLSDLRLNKRRYCVVFPLCNQLSPEQLSHISGHDLVDFHRVYLPKEINRIELNTSDQVFLCDQISNIICDIYRSKISLKSVGTCLPVVVDNDEMQLAIDDKLEYLVDNVKANRTKSLKFSPAFPSDVKSKKNKSKVITSASNESATSSALVWFDRFNQQLIKESVEDLMCWNEQVRSYIIDTTLFKQQSALHSAVSSRSEWTPELQQLVKQTVNKIDDAAVGHFSNYDTFCGNCVLPTTVSKYNKPLSFGGSSSLVSSSSAATVANRCPSDYVYFVTHPNGAVEVHNSLTKVHLHVGQYRFSPLPLTIEMVSLTDPRFQLFKQNPNDFPWLYREMLQTMAGFYSSLHSSQLARISDAQMREYVSIAEETEKRGRMSEKEERLALEDRQISCNFRAALHTKEDRAAELIQSMLTRTDMVIHKDFLPVAARKRESRVQQQLGSTTEADDSSVDTARHKTLANYANSGDEEERSGDSIGGSGSEKEDDEQSTGLNGMLFSNGKWKGKRSGRRTSGINTNYSALRFLDNPQHKAFVESQLSRSGVVAEGSVTAGGNEQLLLSRATRKKVKIAMLLMESDALDLAKQSPALLTTENTLSKYLPPLPNRFERKTPLPVAVTEEASNIINAFKLSSGTPAATDMENSAGESDGDVHRKKKAVARVSTKSIAHKGVNSSSASSSRDDLAAFFTSERKAAKRSSADLFALNPLLASSARPLRLIDRAKGRNEEYNRQVRTFVGQRGNPDLERGMNNLFGAHPPPKRVRTVVLQGDDARRADALILRRNDCSDVGSEMNHNSSGINDSDSRNSNDNSNSVSSNSSGSNSNTSNSSNIISNNSGDVSSNVLDEHIDRNHNVNIGNTANNESEAFLRGNRSNKYKVVERLSYRDDESPLAAALDPELPPLDLLRSIEQMASSKVRASMLRKQREANWLKVPGGLPHTQKKIREEIVSIRQYSSNGETSRPERFGRKRSAPSDEESNAEEDSEDSDEEGQQSDGHSVSSGDRAPTRPERPDYSVLLNKFDESALVAVGVLVEELMRDVMLQWYKNETPLLLTERNLRIETFVQLNGVDPRQVPLSTLVETLELLFGRNLSSFEPDIALYQRIATEQYNEKMALKVVDKISTADRPADSVKQWRQQVGMRSEFDALSAETQRARDYYLEVKDVHGPVLPGMTRRKNGRDSVRGSAANSVVNSANNSAANSPVKKRKATATIDSPVKRGRSSAMSRNAVTSDSYHSE